MRKNGKIKVSVVSITYNHSKYIEEALLSMINQDTNFEYEIIIGDDNSTDNTADIIQRISEQHPGIVRPVLRTKNIGIQNNLLDVLSMAKGEYIALCEGDDYWTDPSKLQRQVEFMDANKSYSMCFHPVKVVFEDNSIQESIFPDKKDGFDMINLLDNNFIQTNSVLYRRQDYSSLSNDILPMDWYLHIYHAHFGKIGFIDRVMSVYRRHEGGAWWGSQYSDINFWQKYALQHINLFKEIKKLPVGQDGDNRVIIDNREAELLEEDMDLIRINDSSKEGADLVRKIISSNPDAMVSFVRTLTERGAQSQLEITRLSQLNKDLTEQIALIDEVNKKEIQRIIESKSYEIGRAIVAPYRFLRKLMHRHDS